MNPFKKDDEVSYLNRENLIESGIVTQADSGYVYVNDNIIPYEKCSFTPFTLSGFSHERPAEEVTEKHIGRMVVVLEDDDNDTEFWGRIAMLTDYDVETEKNKYCLLGNWFQSVRLATKDECLATFKDGE